VPPGPSPSAAAGALPVPYEADGVCPFECCVYRSWTVRRATDVRRARRADAPVAFRLAAGGRVDAVTGVVVVSRPGRGRALGNAAVEGLPLRAGDEVAILHPIGEGYWKVWRNGTLANAQVGDPPKVPSRWQPDVQMLEKPEFTWWVQVKDAQGRTGWTSEPDNFGDKDRCA
jgi:hypothetical protein